MGNSLPQTAREILNLFDGAGDEPVTAPEVAEHIGYSRRTAYDKLDSLVDQGILKTKKVGASGRVWWPACENELGFVAENPTKNNETSETLLKNDDRFREMLDALPEAVYTTDAEGRLTYFNEAAVEFSGRTPELGTDEWCVTWKLFWPGGTRMPHEECPMAVAMKEGRSIRGAEAVAERPDGTRVRFEAYPSPLTDENGKVVGGINMLVDVTERKRLKEELRQSEERLADFFENAAVPMHWVGADGTVLRVNQAELNALGYTRDEYVGSHIADFHADEDVIQDILERLSAGEELRDYEARMTCKDGSIRHVLINSNVLWEEDEFVHTRCVTRDVTERKRLQEDLKQTVERLEQSNGRLREFAYAASHDLQEPLRMVSSYLQLLESRYKDELDTDAEEYIEFAVDGADRMREMVQDLLAYSRIEESDGEFTSVECDAIVERVLANLKVQIEETDAEIVADTLPTIKADENQLEQLFQNLISNALKYNDGSPRVEINADQQNGHWQFSVADNGIGVDPDRTDRIFEVFKRLHHDDEYPGTGIGLSMCQKIVENHHGEIWVESEPGEGSIFIFTLPQLAAA